MSGCGACADMQIPAFGVEGMHACVDASSDQCYMTVWWSVHFVCSCMSHRYVGRLLLWKDCHSIQSIPRFMWEERLRIQFYDVLVLVLNTGPWGHMFHIKSCDYRWTTGNHMLMCFYFTFAQVWLFWFGTKQKLFWHSDWILPIWTLCVCKVALASSAISFFRHFCLKKLILHQVASRAEEVLVLCSSCDDALSEVWRLRLSHIFCFCRSPVRAPTPPSRTRTWEVGRRQDAVLLLEDTRFTASVMFVCHLFDRTVLDFKNNDFRSLAAAMCYSQRAPPGGQRLLWPFGSAVNSDCLNVIGGFFTWFAIKPPPPLLI